MTKCFYITISLGYVESILVMGTPEFDHCVRKCILNPSLLSKDELDLFLGYLTVMGLLKYYAPSNDYGIYHINYGSVIDSDS